MKKAATGMGHILDIHSDNTARVRGIDFETNKIHVIARNDKTIVLKIPGHSCWSGNYTPRHHVGVQYIVYRILKEEQKGTVLHVEPMIEWFKADEKVSS